MRDSEPLPEGQAKVRAVREMFDSIAPRYDVVNRVMTLGMDVGWRRKCVRSLGLPPGSLVLDAACGTGDLCREVEAAGYAAIGIDMSAGMLARARTRAPLVQADALSLPLGPGRVDGVTCGFALRNVADLAELFAEFARVVRVGGRLAVLEVGEPHSPVVRAGHRIYFHRVVPVIGGLLSDRDAYRYLPRSTAYLPESDELLRALSNAGFAQLSVRQLGLGAAQLITGSRA